MDLVFLASLASLVSARYPRRAWLAVLSIVFSGPRMRPLCSHFHPARRQAGHIFHGTIHDKPEVGMSGLRNSVARRGTQWRYYLRHWRGVGGPRILKPRVDHTL